MSVPTLESLWRCFDGVVPTLLATCDQDGIPNASLISNVSYVDAKHVAISRQFFNKTTKNLLQNPDCLAVMWDPIDLRMHRLRLRHVRAETEGALFEAMAARIQVIASHVGMQGIFRLIAADIFEVVRIEADPELLDPAPPDELEVLPPTPGLPTEHRSELWVLHRLQMEMQGAANLDCLFETVLGTLAETLGFEHGLLLVPDESGTRLVTIASRGYGKAGVGAEVPFGEGLLGIVAEKRKSMRLGPVESALRYGRAARGRAVDQGARDLGREIPLPGLANAQSQLAMPLLAHGELVGVLAFESPKPHAFEAWHQVFLDLLADRFAHAMADMLEPSESPDLELPPPSITLPEVPQAQKRPSYALCFYKNDDCIFVDGHYLVRGVPARILWRLLNVLERESRDEFTNRELRLDPWLGLPPIRDNLESRLVLLRRRLAERCPEMKLTPRGRGRFGLELDCTLSRTERASASIEPPA